MFEAFAGRGVDGLLLKGAALARLLYDEPGQRRYSDVDVLVDPDDLPDARAALLELGYRNASAQVAVDDIAGVLHGESWLAMPAGVSYPVVVDLHLHLAGAKAPVRAAWKALKARHTRIEVAGTQVPCLDRVGSAMHLATHAAQHGQGYARGCRELARALDRWPPAVWREAAVLADEVEATEAFAAGLRLVEPGAELAQSLELPSTNRLDWELRQAAESAWALPFAGSLGGAAPSARGRMSCAVRCFPTRAGSVEQYPWAREGRGRMPAAYLLHIARSPAWALRAGLFRLRQRRAGSE